jgi:hypothetical protein
MRARRPGSPPDETAGVCADLIQPQYKPRCRDVLASGEQSLTQS